MQRLSTEWKDGDGDGDGDGVVKRVVGFIVKAFIKVSHLKMILNFAFIYTGIPV